MRFIDVTFVSKSFASFPQQIVSPPSKTDFSLESLNYPELPTFPEPARPKPHLNGVSSGPGQIQLNSSTDFEPFPTDANRNKPPVTPLQQPNGSSTSSSATTIFHQPQAPEIPVIQPIPNSTTIQQQPRLQGPLGAPHHSLPNGDASKTNGFDDNDVTRRMPKHPPDQQPRPNQKPVNPNQVSEQPMQNTPRQTIPNASQEKSNGQFATTNNQSQITHPTNSQSPAGNAFPQNQPSQSGTAHPKVEPVTPSNTVITNNLPVRLPPSHPPTVTAIHPQQPPAGMLAPHIPYDGYGQYNPALPSTVTAASKATPIIPSPFAPTLPSMVQQPNPNGMLPNTNNSPTQPNIARNPTHVSQGQPTTIPPNSNVISSSQSTSTPVSHNSAILSPNQLITAPTISSIVPPNPPKSPNTNTPPNQPKTTIISQNPASVSPSQVNFTPSPPNTTHLPQRSPSVHRSTYLPSVPQTFATSRTGMTHGLPAGWDRVLDRKTGRYYFRDHNTKTTHWNLPQSLTQTMNQSIIGHNAPTVKEVEPKKSSLKRSLSSPNLAKIDDEKVKPSSPDGATYRPTVNRRTKPLTESQLASLNPSHGGNGRALTGFRNLGNSCYMNSVLQCLVAMAPLARYVLSSYYLDDINHTNPLGTGGRIAEELAVLMRIAHSGNYRAVSPFEFKRTIGKFAPEFGGMKQQDSQEFLLVLLDQFHEDTNMVSHT